MTVNVAVDSAAWRPREGATNCEWEHDIGYNAFAVLVSMPCHQSCRHVHLVLLSVKKISDGEICWSPERAPLPDDTYQGRNFRWLCARRAHSISRTLHSYFIALIGRVRPGFLWALLDSISCAAKHAMGGGWAHLLSSTPRPIIALLWILVPVKLGLSGWLVHNQDP